MKQHLNNSPETLPYNKAVRMAYFQILKEAKSLLATIAREELRYTLVREEKAITEHIRVIHEFVSPLLYLRLECDSDNLFVIHYGFEQIGNDAQLSNQTSYFTRSVYRLTSKEVTSLDIEACVSNSWCITECSSLYEYVIDQAKHHEFYIIKYKGTAKRRKEIKLVA